MDDQQRIENYINSYFGKNEGVEQNVPFRLETENERLYSVDSMFQDGAYTRFQGIIVPTMNGEMYIPHSYSVPPLFIFPLVKSYRVLTLYESITFLCWTLVFKEPLTEEIWKEISKPKT